MNGSETASGVVYVYAANSSGTLIYRLSDEAPDLLDESGNAIPSGALGLYQLYSGTYYRCVGCVQNISSDLAEGSAISWDLNLFSQGMFTGDGSDRTQTLGWRGKYIVTLYGDLDTTPADSETVNIYESPYTLLSQFTLNARHDGGVHDLIGVTTAGTINTNAGSNFIVDAFSSGFYVFWVAWTGVQRTD